MNRRRRNRRNRIIMAYIARALVALVAIIMLILMWCGCLYIKEHFIDGDSAKDSKTEEDVNKNTEDAGNKDNGNTDDKNQDATPSDDSNPVDGFVGTSVPAFTYPDATGLTIVLDAGHGGGDPGTLGEVISEDILEKDINLSVVKKMKALLEDCGAKVILTRSEDKRLSLEDRSYLSNRTGAHLFVSIHCNSYEDSSISGLEYFYHKRSEISKEYAENMLAVTERIGAIKARYAIEQNYQVLRDSSIPAVLVEMGYLTNVMDCKNLTSATYQDAMAQTIVTAIVETLKDTN